MAEKLIFPQTELSFAFNETFGAFGYTDYTPDFILETGKDYIVEWDGVRYTRTAFAYAAPDGSQCVGVGNTLAAGLESNGDMFAVVHDHTHSLLYFLSLEQADSHTVAIYEGATGGADQQEGIILLDYKDEPTAYYGREVLEVPSTVEGESVNYVREDLVPETVEKTLDLDFSGGAMTVTPEAGQAFSKVNIPVPEGLAPENIPEGMTIAGIVGAMVVAGGSSLKIATGETSETGGPITIEHGLGVVPDFIYFGTKANTQGIRKFLCAYGFSAAFIALTGDKLRGRCMWGENTNFYQKVNDPVESTTVISGIHNATATTFQVTNSTYPLSTVLGANQWVAIAGLT